MPQKPTYDELEQKVKALSETSFEAIFLSEKGICIDQNQAAERMFGYTHAEAIGRDGTTWIAPEHRKQVKDNMLSGYEKPYEVVALRKDGTRFPCEIQARMVDYKGRLIRVTTLLNITERKQLQESEAKFRGLVESSSDWIWEVNTKGIYTYASPMVEDMMGYKPEEIIGKTPFDLMPPKEAKRIAKIFQKLLSKGKPIIALENINLHKDGRRVVLETSGVPVFNEAGNIIGYQGVDRDITERMTALAALSESEKKYRFLAENVTDVIWTTDLNLNYTYFSPSIERLQGYTPEEAMDLSIEQTLPPDSFDKAIKIFYKEFEKLKSGKRNPDIPTKIELEVICKDGSTIPVEIEANFIFTENGMPEGILGVTREIAERKKVEKALKQAHEELDQRVKDRTKELEMQKIRLEEVNTALNVMLKKRDEDKQMIEEKVLFNVKELIEPLIKNLKNSGLDDHQNAYVDTLEAFLKNIVSPFSRSLHATFKNLTLSEIRVANLVKEGKTTKEIAVLLNSTPRAIEFHRQNIRKKLGLRNRKANLGTHLLTIPE